MATPANENDPRVKRTRQLLLQAFISLLEERHTIHSISVQEITERATVNRATFYAHFEDKYALLEVWMREKFHHVLESQFSTTSTLQRSTLHLLILAVFDFLALWQYHLKPADRQFVPFFEVALQQELQEVLLNWLKQVPLSVPVCQETGETTALVISWAIFGPAVQWSRGDQTITKDVMAHHVLAIVIAGLSPVVTVT
ncbi:TetR/AcrR family transcriptional regulator [Dictyobacter arantiisoli]|uniref:TetR family transcriptional regulator n=1 Tax=Dictyobacter arantiisoli TaxID=2014874 RepID=A0A5A5TEJ6_9CHLR|nr:TetR/AcrR family transcriptional regulator [Dictyobacter arantiisoli]GCF09334.1 TetR family transcriptional regulator [Dictyobacter arantiisoli]